MAYTPNKESNTQSPQPQQLSMLSSASSSAIDPIHPTCLALSRIFMEKQLNYNLLNLQHSISSFTYLCRYLRLPCYKLRILRHNNLCRCQSILPSRLNPVLCRFLKNLVQKCVTYICQLHPS
jgi:hypothetical protein